MMIKPDRYEVAVHEHRHAHFTRSPHGVFVVDTLGRFLYVNPAGETLAGYPAAHLRRMSVRDIRIEELPGLLKQFFRRIFLQGNARRVIALTDGHGAIKWVEIDVTRVDRDRFICFCRDITALERFESYPHSAAARCHELINTLPDIFYVFSERRGGIYWSPSVETVLGYSLESLHSNKLIWNKSIHPEDMAAVTQVITADKLGKLSIAEYRIRDAKGNWIWLYDRSMALRTEDGDLVVKGLATKIMRPKSVQGKRDRETDRLQEEIAEKDMLFSIIAHDLKSPLSGVLTLTRMMLTDQESMSREELRAATYSMNDTVERTYKLLENLLSWARLQRDQIAFNPSSHSLLDIMREGLEIPLGRAELKSITVDWDVPDGFHVHADQAMLVTILRNLLCNAVKFTHPGGSILICAHECGGQTSISIHDTGVGMDQKTMNVLFAVKSSSKGLGTSGERGTGLGLLLCRELVRKHGGGIRVVSALGKGTTITITLPGPGYPPRERGGASQRQGVARITALCSPKHCTRQTAKLDI
jgi:PAS domain S-box-containing protein